MVASAKDESPVRQPTLFLTHGAGPCFFMDWPGNPDTWVPMRRFLADLPGTLPSPPRAILAVSAHWEASRFTVNTGRKPPMLFDYSGFPEHTYQLDFPARGDPELAGRVAALLTEAGLPCGSEPDRGFDHGVFVPLLVAWPKAEVPVVQLSLRSDLDADIHLRAGAALATLRDEGVLLIGSGSSYHNLRDFARGSPQSELFDRWLTEAVQLAPESRDLALRRWMLAPAARHAHPREEHLLPLMVAAGAAPEETGRKIFEGRISSVVSAFRFG